MPTMLAGIVTSWRAAFQYATPQARQMVSLDSSELRT